MKLDAIEQRLLLHYLSKVFESEKKLLQQLDQDTDEYVELANDLMVLDVLISKIGKENPTNPPSP